jgi:hypothetical protein
MTQDVHPGLLGEAHAAALKAGVAVIRAAQQENIMLVNVREILVSGAGDETYLYAIKRQARDEFTAEDAKMAFMPVEFFTDEQYNRWVKFWPKNGPAKGKQMSIPIERLLAVIHD